MDRQQLSIAEELQKYQLEKQRQEHLQHRDVLLAIASLIKTEAGQTLFKYLFKSLDVMNLPDQSMKGETLHEYLGFLRAGNSIYKLTCEAAHDEAASILSKLERERYDDLSAQYRIQNGYGANTADNRE